MHTLNSTGVLPANAGLTPFQAKLMLNNTIALGVTADLLSYSKQYDEKNGSYYSVAGLTPTTKRTLHISHQPASSGSVRSMIDLTETDVDPASVAGSTADSRLYVVIQRSRFKTAAQVQSMRVRLKTLVDDSAFWAQILNQEV